MVSNCPSCKKEITHEDFLFEVECECGMHYNPFYDLGGEAGSAGSDAGAAQDSAEGFSESRSAFEDIVKYGEGMEEPKKAPPAKPAPVAETPSDKREAPVSAVPANISSSECVMITGNSVPGYQIEKHLKPISASCPVSLERENPLDAGFTTLWKQCLSVGGNALIHLQWQMSADGSLCLLTGTPVRCIKAE